MNTVTVYAMHGVVREKNNLLLTHATLDSWAQFEEHLAGRPHKYVPLSAALDGEGDALTIDDATVAAKHAAELARKHGHDATMFVNPCQVAMEKPYYLHQLSTMVDTATVENVAWDGMLCPLMTAPDKKAFRERVKQRFCQLAGEADRTALLELLATKVKPSNITVPDCLATLSAAQLGELLNRRISIQNHGWSHPHFGSLSQAEVQREINDAGQWLERQGFCREAYFAVPFGDILPRHDMEAPGCSVWFTLTGALGRGPIGARRWKRPRVWNRLQLEFSNKN